MYSLYPQKEKEQPAERVGPQKDLCSSVEGHQMPWVGQMPRSSLLLSYGLERNLGRVVPNKKGQKSGKNLAVILTSAEYPAY